MENRWKTVETVADFIFGGSKITVDGDCSHEIKRCLLLGRKVMTNLDSIFKSRDITLPSKGPSSQGYGFSCGHVWMWELGCEEGWAPKNWSLDYMFSICSLWFFFQCFPYRLLIVLFIFLYGSLMGLLRSLYPEWGILSTSSFISHPPPFILQLDGESCFLLSFIYFMVVVRLITYSPPHHLCSRECWLGSVTER